MLDPTVVTQDIYHLVKPLKLVCRPKHWEIISLVRSSQNRFVIRKVVLEIHGDDLYTIEVPFVISMPASSR